LEVLEGHSGGVNGVAFSPDGSLLVSGSADASLRLWRIADGETLHILDENIDGVNDVAFSPSGLLIASGSADGTIGMWGVLV
jgi:WD40 repeat protein